MRITTFQKTIRGNISSYHHEKSCDPSQIQYLATRTFYLTKISSSPRKDSAYGGRSQQTAGRRRLVSENWSKLSASAGNVAACLKEVIRNIMFPKNYDVYLEKLFEFLLIKWSFIWFVECCGTVLFFAFSANSFVSTVNQLPQTTAIEPCLKDVVWKMKALDQKHA